MRRIVPANDAIITIFKKDPQAELEYGFNWSEWLDDVSGETITDSSWNVPSGLTNMSESNSSGITTVKLSGGTAGESYRVTNSIVTATRKDDRSFIIKVGQR